MNALLERQQRMQERYLRVVEGYRSRPFAIRHTAEMYERELEKLECEMLDYPPLYKAGSGVWHVRSKGLDPRNILIHSKELPLPQAMSFAEAGLKAIPEREWSDVIDDPNRTPPSHYFTDEVDQDGNGSCAGEGAANAGTCRRRQDGQEHVLLNGYFNYHFSSGGVDRGSSLQENISVMQKYGCCSVEVRSRSRGWRAKPNDAEMEDAEKYKLMPDGVVQARNKIEMGTLCLMGFPTYFGYPGHAILCVDILSTTKLDYQNSWGRDWGNRGRGSLPFSRVEWGYGVYSFISMGDKR